MERSYQNQPKVNAIQLLNSSNQVNNYVPISSLDKIELIPMSKLFTAKLEEDILLFSH
jgi:two-component system LytT family response regulator